MLMQIIVHTSSAYMSALHEGLYVIDFVYSRMHIRGSEMKNV